MSKRVDWLLTMALFCLTAFEVGYAVHKPDPFNIGLAVFVGLVSIRAIAMDAVRDQVVRT